MEVRAERPIEYEVMELVDVDQASMNVVQQVRDCCNRLIEIMFFGPGVTSEGYGMLTEIITKLGPLTRDTMDLYEKLHLDHGNHPPVG